MPLNCKSLNFRKVHTLWLSVQRRHILAPRLLLIDLGKRITPCKDVGIISIPLHIHHLMMVARRLHQTMAILPCLTHRHVTSMMSAHMLNQWVACIGTEELSTTTHTDDGHPQVLSMLHNAPFEDVSFGRTHLVLRQWMGLLPIIGRVNVSTTPQKDRINLAHLRHARKDNPIIEHLLQREDCGARRRS